MFISTTKLKDQVLYNAPDPEEEEEAIGVYGCNDGG